MKNGTEIWVNWDGIWTGQQFGKMFLDPQKTQTINIYIWNFVRAYLSPKIRHLMGLIPDPLAPLHTLFGVQGLLNFGRRWLKLSQCWQGYSFQWIQWYIFEMMTLSCQFLKKTQKNLVIWLNCSQKDYSPMMETPSWHFRDSLAKELSGHFIFGTVISKSKQGTVKHNPDMEAFDILFNWSFCGDKCILFIGKWNTTWLVGRWRGMGWGWGREIGSFKIVTGWMVTL